MFAPPAGNPALAPDMAQMTPAGYPPAGYDYANNVAAAQAAQAPAPAPLAPAATVYPALVDPVMAQRTAALQSELSKQDERLQRVERAMLRLDRRMQLVERNELGRMKTAALDDGTAPMMAGARSGTAAGGGVGDDAGPETADAAIPALPSPRRANYGEGFQPVSTAITSALQAAPDPRAEPDTAVRSGGQIAAASLPSLADQAPAMGRVPGEDDHLAIWTVHYDNDKVWPDRTELPSSRDVVTLLREGQATVFARGAQPNSREFRERVKAISRYLAKVTSLDSVPIAALAAPHLDGNTIEIFASP
jgi:hypothetical protein